MRRHGERRSECAGDRTSVVPREKSRDTGWKRFVCCSDCVSLTFAGFVTKSCKSCVDLSPRKVKGKLRGVSFWYASPRMAEMRDVLVAVSESDMSHDVFFPCYDEGTQACAYHEGMLNKRSLRIASRDCSSQCSDDWKERQFRFELVTSRAGTDRGYGDHECKLRVHEVPET